MSRPDPARERARLARAEAVLEAAIDGILTIDQRGTIEFANAAAARIFGYTVADLTGQPISILMPESVAGDHGDYLQAYLQGGKPDVIGRGRELTARRADGTLFPIEIGVSEALDGDRRIFTAMVRDLSDSRAARQEIEQSHERLRSIVESVVDGIVTIDERGTIETINGATERIFGYSAEEIVGRNVRELMPSPFREEHDRYLRRYITTGERRIIGFGREVRGRRKDGSTFPLDLAVSEGFIGKRRVFTGIIRDLEGLRRAEERASRAEQLAALSTITAGIAHDVGTPMTTILGYAELMEKSVGDEKNRARARQIVEQVRRVTDLLSTLLNIARPRSTEPEPMPIADVIDHSLEFFREKLKGRGVVVERDFADTDPVVADRDRIEEVFLNLIVNAVDAMPKGGTLRVRLGQPSPTLIEIRIADSGVGITPEALERIFEPFYTTKERGKGTGLGLLVSRRIVDDHGGTISAESEEGVGTEFTIRLPAAGAPASEMD